MFSVPPQLPISECLDDLLEQLTTHHHCVLEAPPGAGKTTVVPLALLNTAWLKGQKILVLEPRRVAALNAAHRMAALLGEKVGHTVGYRMRQATCVSAHTRIEVITEGLLARQLQSDPELANIGVIIFDEFHERSIHSDAALAMALVARALFRENNPLKLIVMSATLDGQRLTRYLALDAPCPLVTSRGRTFPIDIRYHALLENTRIDEIAIARFIVKIMKENAGNALVFLPGAGEINKTLSALTPLVDAQCDVLALHGSLSLEAQQKAILPPTSGFRKIVLATDIAETSLTIEGVRIVIDTGLARKPQFDPNSGMTRLATEKISKASAEQRAGRAGRTEPGIAYRLWSEQDHQQRREFTPPEILNADLMPLVLSLMNFGCHSADELMWLDSPPKAHWQQALDQLATLGAIANEQLTATGEQFTRFPCHPRLARILITGDRIGKRQLACELAAILSERSPSELGNDLHDHLHALSSDKKHLKPWQHRVTTLAKQFQSLLPKTSDSKIDWPYDDAIGMLIASGFPERIARRKSAQGNDNIFKLANGRQAQLASHQPLAHETWIAIADAGGVKESKTDRIFSAASLNPDYFNEALKHLVTTHQQSQWDLESGRYRCEDIAKIGDLTLYQRPQQTINVDARTQALIQLLQSQQLKGLHWSDNAAVLRTRMQFLHTTLGANWPDVSDSALAEHLDDWLAPALTAINHLNELKSIELADYLLGLLPWPMPNTLNELAPSTMTIASGRAATIDYSQNPPVIAVKLQEMFGSTANPTLVNGAVKINIHLLSPNGRPLAMTGDISFFWKNAYPEVKKEMRGRYPKHPWPDDPLSALATAKTNRALRGS